MCHRPKSFRGNCFTLYSREIRPVVRTAVDTSVIPSRAMTKTIIRIAHSPDSDDAFMFYALTQGLLDTDGLEIRHVLQDIETLNQAAFKGTYEITALSFHAYAHLADRYQLMPSGASFGDNYGPVVVSRSPKGRADLVGCRVAVPGELTTANLDRKSV